MKTLFGAAIAAALLFGAAAEAGPISRACMASDRKAATPARCGCIQRAADMTLDRRDQRLAAKFFRKPDMAMDVKMSKTADHDRFWDRYKQFGAMAEATCS